MKHYTDGLFRHDLHDLLHLDFDDDSVEEPVPLARPLVPAVRVVVALYLTVVDAAVRADL